MKVELILKEQLIDSTYRELDIFKVEILGLRAMYRPHQLPDRLKLGRI